MSSAIDIFTAAFIMGVPAKQVKRLERSGKLKAIAKSPTSYSMSEVEEVAEKYCGRSKNSPF